MGHPAPFNLKFIGIGNEQWGKEYPERLEPFIKAIRKAHPEIKIVGSSGPNSEGKEFDYLWPEMKRLKVDLVDEHPEYSYPNHKRLRELSDHYSDIGRKVRNSESAEVPHPFPQTAGNIRRIPIHSFDNNQGRIGE